MLSNMINQKKQANNTPGDPQEEKVDQSNYFMFLREIGSISTSQRCLLDHCFNEVYGVPIAEAIAEL